MEYYVYGCNSSIFKASHAAHGGELPIFLKANRFTPMEIPTNENSVRETVIFLYSILFCFFFSPFSFTIFSVSHYNTLHYKQVRWFLRIFLEIGRDYGYAIMTSYCGSKRREKFFKVDLVDFLSACEKNAGGSLHGKCRF